MKRVLFLTMLLIAVLGLLSACSAQQSGSEVGIDTGVATSEVEAEVIATVVEPTLIASVDDPLMLLWEGRPLGEGAGGEACGRLEIRAESGASFGPCGGSLTTTAFEGSQWNDMIARFAAFDLEGEENHLRFQGQGEVDSPVWQSALAAWARATYGELASGHACAACRTILSWSLGSLSQTPERCAVLWITDFGYASLGDVPCAGGQTEVMEQGWLETEEWTQLEEWLRDRAPLSLGENGATSFLGQGSQPMSADEQAQLEEWATTVAARLGPGLELSTTFVAAAEKGLCPDVPRPALGLFIPGEGYLITDPLSGKECYTTLDGDVPGLFQAANGAVYYTVLQDDQFVVKRLDQDGAPSLLSFTAVDRDDALLYHSFVVSADGERIAWSATSAGADFSGPEVSNMWLAGIDGADVVAPLPELQSEGENRRALVPVRFSEDNSTLFYTLQPIGLGGMWSSFVGRYDNLYALRLATEAEPTPIFDCSGERNILCIGDFIELEGQVTTLAYVDEGSVVILNGAGAVLNTIALDDDYLGYPTFGPGGELVFYGADLDEGPNASILPLMGTIYRVAPPTAPHEVLASSPGLLFPADWLDGTHAVVGYASGDNWGTAIVGLDGSLQVLQSEPNASFAAVLSR